MAYPRQILKNRPLIYRYPKTFIYLGTLIGTSIVLSPLIYTFTHSSEEIQLKKAQIQAIVPTPKL